MGFKLAFVLVISALISSVTANVSALCAETEQNQPGSHDNELDANELETRLAAVYERTSPAVMSAEWSTGGSTGVIVTPEGHVLTTCFPRNAELSFILPDGRRAGGRALGISNEWNIGLARLDGPGPWPHVAFPSSAQPT